MSPVVLGNLFRSPAAGRFDGIAGLVWYASVTPTRGDELKIGDWLDSLDHSGARSIHAIRKANPGTDVHEVAFSPNGFHSGDYEVVRDNVIYDVVNPNSQVDPIGTPMNAPDGGRA